MSVTPTTSVTTVSLRQEDVQAIVSGLAANPSALAAVALMMQSDDQQAGPSGLSSASSSSGHAGKSPFISGSPHQAGTSYHFSSLHTRRE